MLQLNKNNYFSQNADSNYMSVSQFKSFKDCEARTLAKLRGEWQDNDKDALLLGSYVHSWNEEALEKFKLEHPEMYSSRGETKGKLKSQFLIADKMINTLANDELITRVREGQKEVVMTAELFGVSWKIMIDVYNPGVGTIVDLKTVRSIHKKYYNENTGKYENFIQYYDYLLQMAVYCEVERINKGASNYLKPHIIAISKEEIPDKAIIFLGTDFIQDKLLEVEILLPHIIEVKKGRVKPQRCEKCDYCKSTQKIKSITHYLEL